MNMENSKMKVTKDFRKTFHEDSIIRKTYQERSKTIQSEKIHKSEKRLSSSPVKITLQERPKK